MREALSYLAYRTGWAFVGALPEKWAYSLFDALARRMYQRNGKSVHRLRANYSIVMRDKTQVDIEIAVMEGLRSYLRYWCDTFRIHTWSRERILATVDCNKDFLLTDPIDQARGVVIALPHSGNWDHAGAYFCARNYPLVTVAEILKPRKLYDKFVHYREGMGFEVLPLESRTFVQLLRRAREKRLIALVADRDLSDSGVEVEFFGRKAKMPAGPALLAIKEGIPLVVAHVSYTETGIQINFTEIEISQAANEQQQVSETVQRMATAFEVGISAHLVDWHMLQRIWVEDGIYQ